MGLGCRMFTTTGAWGRGMGRAFGPWNLFWGADLGRCPSLVWRCAVGASECGEAWKLGRAVPESRAVDPFDGR